MSESAGKSKGGRGKARGVSRTGKPIRGRKTRGISRRVAAVGMVVSLAGVVITGVALGSGAPTVVTTPPSTVGKLVDGIPCQSSEVLTYHVHAHILVIMNGNVAPVPAGVGIVKGATLPDKTVVASGLAGSCLYWLHTHAADGIIHIEAPQAQSFTLGQFFDIWPQTLNGSQVGLVKGKVQVYVNGQLYLGDPRGILLLSHTYIQLNVGKVEPVQPYTFPSGL